MRGDQTIDDGVCGINALLDPADAAPVPAGATAAACHDQAAADRFWTKGLWPAARTAELLRLRECAMSAGQIARELGITRNAVMGKLSRMGLCKPRTRMTLERYRLQRREQKARRRARLAAARPPVIVQAPDVVPPVPSPMPPVAPRRRTAGHGVTIWDLKDCSCRWPLFHGDEPFHQKFYCGDEAISGAPYCGEHFRVSRAGGGRA